MQDHLTQNDRLPVPSVVSEAGARQTLRGLLFVAAFLLVWISTDPFKGVNHSDEAASNVVNQIAFSLMALLSLGGLLLVDRRALKAYARPIWIVLLCWMAVTVILSNNFAVSFRATQFSAVVILIAAVAMLMPTGAAHFARLIGTVALVMLGLNYAGLVVFPGAAIHTSGDIFEPEHAGAWRGLFDHKNIAGGMMVIFLMIGFYVLKAWGRLPGMLIIGLSATFLLFSMSKTSMALGPLVLVISWFCTRAPAFWMRCVVALGPLALLLIFTVGSVLLPPVNDLLQAISPGQTFTGRTELWGFAFDRLAQRPIIGFGFEGFWGSDQVRFAEIGEFEAGIAQGMVHGHNSYVDAVIGLGIPGLVLVMLVLVVLPLRDHFNVQRFSTNEAMAELFLRIWLFAIYSACLESFFFRRADPVWFAMLVAAIGLRLLSRYRVAA
ncbi:MAG: O-antigen ligase family protein [Bosea sp. (in: a-proteobacteria)]